jgi:hypothetical protein
MKCRQCGRTIPVFVSFCAYCGEPVQPMAQTGISPTTAASTSPNTHGTSLPTWTEMFGGIGAEVFAGIAVVALAVILGSHLGSSTPGATSGAANPPPDSQQVTPANTKSSALPVAQVALEWHTFLGGDGNVFAYGCAFDDNGDVYAVVHGGVPWGGEHGKDSTQGSVVKLDATGNLIWQTHLDSAQAIAVDMNDRIYVAGRSNNTWGAPIHGYSGGSDAFVASLASDGTLNWHTFLGGQGGDEAASMTTDGSGHVYVVGTRSLSE